MGNVAAYFQLTDRYFPGEPNYKTDILKRSKVIVFIWAFHERAHMCDCACAVHVSRNYRIAHKLCECMHLKIPRTTISTLMKVQYLGSHATHELQVAIRATQL